MFGSRIFTNGSCQIFIVVARCSANVSFQSPARTAMTSPSSLK
jgi:hypothetical protein